MFTMSNKRCNASARNNTVYAIHSSFSSPINEWPVSMKINIPQSPQFVASNIMSGSNPSTDVDLNLRLDLPGTNVINEVPDDLTLTLGNKAWELDSNRRGVSPITEVPPTRIKVQPTKTQGFVGSSRANPKKRDYYGPCVRCGKVFETSQHYASHMSSHARKDAIEERVEKMAKILKFEL
ncbi:putative transcription factor C2H2 family [Helianthus anomalus]